MSLDRIDYLYIYIYGVDNSLGGSNLMIETDLIPKYEFSDDYQDLHDVLLRIYKFARTELELYSKEKMSQGG